MLINAIILFIAVLTHQNNMSVTTTVQPATESLSRHGWVVSQFFNFNILKTLCVWLWGFLFRFQQFFVNFSRSIFSCFIYGWSISFIKLSENTILSTIFVYIFFYDIVDLQFKFVHRGKRFRNLICIDLFNRSIFIFI